MKRLSAVIAVLAAALVVGCNHPTPTPGGGTIVKTDTLVIHDTLPVIYDTVPGPVVLVHDTVAVRGKPDTVVIASKPDTVVIASKPDTVTLPPIPAVHDTVVKTVHDTVVVHDTVAATAVPNTVALDSARSLIIGLSGDRVQISLAGPPDSTAVVTTTKDSAAAWADAVRAQLDTLNSPDGMSHYIGAADGQPGAGLHVQRNDSQWAPYPDKSMRYTIAVGTQAPGAQATYQYDAGISPSALSALVAAVQQAASRSP